MTPQIIRLGRHGAMLGTRALGAEIATEIRDADPTAPGLIIDFSDVQIASSPLLDEVACAIRATITDHPERYVILAHLNADVADTLELVVERRDIILTRLTGDKLKFLGGREHLETTLAEAAAIGRPFTAPELAERLELKLPNLHQRLTQLSGAGALTKTDDPSATRGRRLLFVAPTVDELTDALSC